MMITMLVISIVIIANGISVAPECDAWRERSSGEIAHCFHVSRYACTTQKLLHMLKSRRRLPEAVREKVVAQLDAEEVMIFRKAKVISHEHQTGRLSVLLW